MIELEKGMFFSIITPFYNVEQYAHKCVDSVLEQTFADFEYICVDDGSTDHTLAILEEYAAKDSRIKIIHKENGGVVSARKIGAQAAQGKYVIVLDSDDWLDTNCLAEFKLAISAFKPDMVICGYYKTNEERSIESVRPAAINGAYGLIHTDAIEQNVHRNPFSISPTLWGKAIKKETYVKYQMLLDNKIAMGDDGAVIYPLLFAVKSIYVLDKCLYYYRYNPTSMTKNKQRVIPVESVILRLNHLEEALPSNMYQKERHLSRYAVHAFMNSAISMFRTKKPSEAREIVQMGLYDPVIRRFLQYRPNYASLAEKASYFALKHKMLWLIKLYAIKRY